MKKSRILIGCMYLLLIITCVGILHILDIDRGAEPVTGHEPASQEESSSLHEEQPTEKETEKETIKETSPEVTEETTTEAAEEDAGLPIIQETRQPAEETAEETKDEEDKGPISIMLATDLHYYSAQITDHGPAFQKMEASDDGKIVGYSPEILESLLDTVLEEKPWALVLSGDLTLNGEKISHEELARRLLRVKEAGIPVLVIPGNHDINNNNAASYFESQRETVESITPEEFYQIYYSLGYEQAISQDENSLSYLYALDDKNWLMMLDSCQYLPQNLVDGRIRPETVEWMEAQFQIASEKGARIIPVAHHNLLDESLLYPTECTIINNQELIDMFEKWNVPLFLSGHLHLQRLKQYKPEEGKSPEKQHVYEAVTGSLAIPPCQYSRLEWLEDDGFRYETKKLDVEAWAEKTGNLNEDLLQFEDFSAIFLEKLMADKIYGKLEYLPESHMVSMSLLYSQLNSAYCAGIPIDFSQIKKSAAFEQWERSRPETKLFEDIMAMIQDSENDNNNLVIPGIEE